MAEWGRNYAFTQPVLAEGDVAEGANFEQAYPDTVLTGCAGKAITFRHCRLINVHLDPAWTVEDCNTTQISRCAHEHQEWVERGFLAAEAEDCPHVVDTDTVVVDGQEVVVARRYEDTIL